MDDKRLRQRCEAKVRELDIHAPFDVRSFCHALAAQRGRPILLEPLAGTAGACGIWVAVPSADLIFYEEETSPLHQDHIILHEISHLVCGHEPVPVSEGEISLLLFPDLQAQTVKHVLQRGGYSTFEEREAETLASLILERAGTGPSVQLSATSVEQEAVLGRLEKSLQAEGSETP
jgi:hypothetical protein